MRSQQHIGLGRWESIIEITEQDPLREIRFTAIKITESIIRLYQLQKKRDYHSKRLFKEQ